MEDVHSLYLQNTQITSPPGSAGRAQTGNGAPGNENIRVSSMAQKFEQQSQPAVPGTKGPEAGVVNVRPSHTHRQSLPILPTSTGSRAKLQEALHASTDLSSTRAWVASHRGPDSIESPGEGQSMRPNEPPHPSICACEICSLKGYDTTQALNGGEGDAWGRIDNEATMRSTRSAANRRVSMPVAMRGTAARY